LVATHEKTSDENENENEIDKKSDMSRKGNTNKQNMAHPMSLFDA
jgi:hypothetical protein